MFFSRIFSANMHSYDVVCFSPCRFQFCSFAHIQLCVWLGQTRSFALINTMACCWKGLYVISKAIKPENYANSEVTKGKEPRKL